MKSVAALLVVCFLASASAFAPSSSVAATRQATSKLHIVPLKRPEGEYTYDDGLTELERKQKSGVMKTFLTGSAKSQVDPTAITDEFNDTTFEIPGWFSAVGSVIGTFILFGIFKASIDPTAYIN